MTEPLDYPRDAPTGPQTAVLPNSGAGSYVSPPQQPQQPYTAYQPTGPVRGQNHPGRPNRLNKAAAIVGLTAGALVIVAVLFGGGFYLGRETAPQPPAPAPTAGGFQQGGPLIIPMPRGQLEGPGGGPTIQLPNIFPGLPVPGQTPPTQFPGQPPR